MLTLDELQKQTKGIFQKRPNSVKIKAFSIDSRLIKKGEAFIAIKGNRFDGHQFIRQAIQRGANAIIVSKKVSCHHDIAILRVKDTTEALGCIAAFHRQAFKIPLIAVTGSAGKTTTKDMIAAILKSRFKVLKNNRTENNQFGVPLTLLRLNKSHEIAVLELGTNRFGDIQWLTEISRPTVAVMTNIGEAHLEGLKDSKGVFREKSRLIEKLSHDGCIIFNKDDDHLKTIQKRKRSQKCITFSIANKSDNQAHLISAQNGSGIRFKLKHKNFAIKTPFEHNVYNALAAICCAELFKIRYPDIKSKLVGFKFQEGRQEVLKINSSVLINDTYNSNPLSLRSAIKTLDTIDFKGRKILVCADMLELGKSAVGLHETIGAMIADTTIDSVVTLGPLSRHISKNLKKFNRDIPSYHYRTQKEAWEFLKYFCQQGDMILIKGSRGMHMEQTFEFLKGQLGHKTL